MNVHGFKTGILIGVRAAKFAQTLLRHWPLCEKLYLVDAYSHASRYPGEPVEDNNNNNFTHDSDEFFASAVERLAEFGSVPQWMRITPKQAAALISDHSVDLVYIDDHHDNVEDLELFWPTLKQGGVMAGHYFLNEEEEARKALPDSDAVIEFVQRKNVAFVYQTAEPCWKSWGIWKLDLQ